MKARVNLQLNTLQTTSYQAVDTLYIATVQTDEAALPYPCVLWV